MTQAKQVALTKIFSREKPLLYFQLWNDSDRLGFRDFLGHELEHAVFVMPGEHQKGSIWYGKEEWEHLSDKRKKVFADPELTQKLCVRLDTHWERLAPYLSEEQPIVTGADFKDYYEHLVWWWSAMTAAFEVPDSTELSQETKDLILSRRAVSEKYTEKMSKLMLGFWNAQFPDLADLAYVVSPNETIALAESRDETLIASLRDRIRGCVLLDEQLYPLRETDAELARRGLVFEGGDQGEVREIKGTTAFKGQATGKVRKIASFADMKDFQSGEVLVTEMTNPDYVPIMRIAAAVVTDEGGMTCHAAIASREMRIPCVVGTKVGTQVLNDGDEVEVDAEKGIVRKI